MEMLWLWYICVIFSIFKIVSNIAFDEKYFDVPPSVYGTLKYYTEKVKSGTLSKVVLPHSILSYSGLSVNIFSESSLLFVPAFDHVAVKNFIEYWNFETFNNS